MSVTGLAADRYAFRTPPLRNVELTGPVRARRRLLRPAGLRGPLQRVGPQAPALRPRAAWSRCCRATCCPTSTAILATRDTMLNGVVFRGQPMDEVTAFMKALTDPAARDLAHVAPARVPSGLPVDGRSRRSAAGAGLLGARGAFVGRQQPPAFRRNLPRRRDRLGDRFAPGRRGQGEPGGLAVAGGEWRQRALPTVKPHRPTPLPAELRGRHLPLRFLHPRLEIGTVSPAKLLGARPRSTRRAGPSSWPTFIRVFPSAAPSFSCSPSCRSAASPRTNCSTRSRPRACYRRDSDTDVPPAWPPVSPAPFSRG